MHQYFPSLVIGTPITDAANDHLVDSVFLEETFLANKSLSQRTGEPIIDANPAIFINPVTSIALLNYEESELFRAHWDEIQTEFVDEPLFAIKKADALVSDVVEKIVQLFANELVLLEDKWNQSTDTSTEDLRVVLQQYRAFFNRLVLKNEE